MLIFNFIVNSNYSDISFANGKKCTRGSGMLDIRVRCAYRALFDQSLIKAAHQLLHPRTTKGEGTKETKETAERTTLEVA